MPSNITRVYIDNDEDLVKLCEQYALSNMLAIDTEFVRTRTLYPKLGLLQVNNGEVLALIDPVAIANLSPFWQLLTNEKIVKVLHACSEDLEVFLSVGQCKPVNLIDSQIMMAFLGHGLSMGYAAMVKHYTEVELDKSESRTDWLKRPLTDKQLKYAQADVEYLFEIFPQIMADIKKTPWLGAAKEETQAMIERKFTPINENELYMNLSHSWKLNPEQLNRLKHLTVWRFQQAQKKDRPIGFIAKDHTLFALASRSPETIDDMRKLEGAEVLDIKHKGYAMLDVLKKANTAESISYPAKIKRLDECSGYKETFKKVKAFLVKKSAELQLLPENIASKKQINQFLSWYFKINGAENKIAAVDLLQGWRLALVGESLKQFSQNKFKE